MIATMGGGTAQMDVRPSTQAAALITLLLLLLLLLLFFAVVNFIDCDVTLRFILVITLLPLPAFSARYCARPVERRLYVCPCSLCTATLSFVVSSLNRS